MDLTDPPPDPPTLVRVESATLSPTAAAHGDHVERTRTELHRRVTRWAKANGYYVAGHRTWSNRDATTAILTLTIEGYLRARTDGEWPSIWAAFYQDARDRRALQMKQPIEWGSPTGRLGRRLTYPEYVRETEGRWP